MTKRIPVSAANWKMHRTNAEADALCAQLQPLAAETTVQVVIASGFLQLMRVAERFGGTAVGIAGQTMHFDEQGAFTGEVSPTQLAEWANWVILGHSERRRYFHEADRSVNRKIQAALAHGLQPIVCVGEQEEEREQDRTETVLRNQVSVALDGIDAPAGFVIAYEPVWAIGTGKAATSAAAQTTAACIRRIVADTAGAETAAGVRILYGGSVTPDNVSDFAAQPDIDGALVGGASLDAEAFLAITRAIAAAKSG